MQIALEQFSEATVGYRKNKEIADKWVKLFNTSYFMVSCVSTGRLVFRQSFLLVLKENTCGGVMTYTSDL